MKRFMIAGRLLIMFALVAFIPSFFAYAQDAAGKTLVSMSPPEKLNDYFSTQTFNYSDGASISRDVINGPSTPPPGYEFERAAVQLPEAGSTAKTSTLTVPAYTWVFGCSAVSASMVAAYYDRCGFPDMYTGPTGDGVMPLTEDASWGTWTDSTTTSYPNNPLIASHNGLDGRVTKGSIDDYWASYLSSASDPYVGAWTQHTPGDAIGDYMKTSQSAYSNVDGSTVFWNYDTSARLTCAAMEHLPDGGGHTISTTDGTYGRKLFYEARGYTVTGCYNQRTDNKAKGGFSFAKYKAEINARRPVLLNLAGHTVVGVGYDDSTKAVYIHDTWDDFIHVMFWGGGYSGMELRSVSIVNLKGSILSTPAVKSVSPAMGAIGIPVYIGGKDFGPKQGTSTVTFNGVEATVSSWSNTRIKATVPTGSATGPVVVTTLLGTSDNTKTYTVKPPLLNSVSPVKGAIGATVTISGKYFGPTQGTSTVIFNGVAATVSTWSDTRIKCTVPVGATTGPVLVHTTVGDSGPKTFTVNP
jgi:hypothetical protein